ncbi:prolipoprotein diacylglyceryl transferase [Basilea psittacipulmonis]|uniref:Phosphatidylglycerol--prolipoprotein diacylglyceryl transferase n=1 Tax=Basilea psittacipulmonis DSM 24701 TaxID=1072685 RepID=A0A077DFP5_9BURK|nr:prolipoprotein diacylglyceryl transferase [Basilea psittacipulmonis]AIL31993.1 hypothetical protein IX83_00440 [Basilea psittacipulmonis DSM 24701]
MLVFPDFDPVAISVAGIDIHWYGLMYLLGFLLAYLLGRYRIRHKQLPFTLKQFEDMLFYGAMGVIIGGRLGFILFYQFQEYMANPIMILEVWKGGMSFHGGFLGVLCAMWLYGYRQKISFFTLTDFIAPLIPLGLVAGRLGNFINGELWGRVTDVPWAMVFPTGGPVPRHPSQLYEMFLEGFLLFAILWVYSRKPRATGKVSGLFLIGYGSFRFLVEFVREPDYFLGKLALGLSMGQWLSLPMIVIGVWLYFVWSKKRSSE